LKAIKRNNAQTANQNAKKWVKNTATVFAVVYEKLFMQQLFMRRHLKHKEVSED
jgi:hypothetical protein